MNIFTRLWRWLCTDEVPAEPVQPHPDPPFRNIPPPPPPLQPDMRFQNGKRTPARKPAKKRPVKKTNSANRADETMIAWMDHGHSRSDSDSSGSSDK